MTMMKLISNNRGGALMIALALMAMLSVVAIVALNRSNTDVDMSYNQLHGDQAFYTAEAGIERALAELDKDRNWNTGFANEPLGRGFYSVAVIDSSTILALDDTIILRATGNVDGSEAEIEAWLVPEYIYPWKFALWGDTILYMSNSACTDSWNSDSGTYGSTLDHTLASIGSNGELTIINIASVGGDAISAIEGGITIDNMAVVRGDTMTGVDPRDLEIVDSTEYVWAQDNSIAETGITGSYTYDPVTYSLDVGANEIAILSSGVYYFSDILVAQNGEIVLEPGAQVVIYMTGDLVLRNTTSINADGIPSQLLIFSTGDLLSIGNNTALTGCFYAPDAEFVFDNYCDFFGSVVAEFVDFRNNTCFHYDRSLAKIKKGETGKLLVVAWREL